MVGRLATRLSRELFLDRLQDFGDGCVHGYLSVVVSLAALLVVLAVLICCDGVALPESRDLRGYGECRKYGVEGSQDSDCDRVTGCTSRCHLDKPIN